MSSQKKLTPFICVLKNGRTVEVKAEKEMDLGEICHKRYKSYPVQITKKPFVRQEHLTDRPFANDSALRSLRKRMNAKAGAR